MENQTDSRRTRDDAIRYWALRVVVIALAFLVLVAGFWSTGRDAVAFLANWSTFCLQAGAIYLFVFEREFLANLVIDILDFIKRVREHRERRAAERAAILEVSKRASAEAETQQNGAEAAASARTPAAVAAKVAATQRTTAAQPIAHAYKPPRFRSRDGAFGVRAVVGLVFVAVIGALLVGIPHFASREPAEAELESAAQPAIVTPPQSDEPLTPAEMPAMADYLVREGESCWAVAERIADGDRQLTASTWLDLLAANEDSCSLNREQILRPGSVLSLPANETEPQE
jgi:hypothetical protein